MTRKEKRERRHSYAKVRSYWNWVFFRFDRYPHKRWNKHYRSE